MDLLECSGAEGPVLFPDPQAPRLIVLYWKKSKASQRLIQVLRDSGGQSSQDYFNLQRRPMEGDIFSLL